MNATTTTMLDALSLDSLLRIPEGEPERLFVREDLKGQYHRLIKRWHPDVNPDARADEAIRHLGALYAAARRKADADVWASPGWRVLKGTDGARREVRFRTERRMEIGEVLVGDQIVVQMIKPEHRDLHENGLRAMGSFRYADAKMEENVGPFLPRIASTFETDDDGTTPSRLVTVIRKTPDQLLLADVIDHFGGHVPTKHAAWILSCLHNLSCWLAWAKISHQAIGPEALFVSPPHHGVAILGGWTYAQPFGEALRALPSRTVTTLPSDALRAKRADPRTDLGLVRRTGREMVGDVPGSRAEAPKPLLDWLRTATTGDAIRDYALWGETRDRALGPRTFSALDLTADDLYSPTPTAGRP